MNNFSDTASSSGLLKNVYEPEKLTEEALKRKRKKLSESVLGLSQDESVEGDDDNDGR